MTQQAANGEPYTRRCRERSEFRQRTPPRRKRRREGSFSGENSLTLPVGWLAVNNNPVTAGWSRGTPVPAAEHKYHDLASHRVRIGLVTIETPWIIIACFRGSSHLR